MESITVKLGTTNHRYEREVRFESRSGLTAEQRFFLWKERQSHPVHGFPTPFEADNGESGTVYLPSR